MEDMDIAVRNPEAPGVLQLQNYRMPFVQSFPSKQAACQALQDVGYPVSLVDKFVQSGRIYPGHSPGGWWSAVNPDFRRLCYTHILNTTHARDDWCYLATHYRTTIPCYVLVAGSEGTLCDPASITEMQTILPEVHVHHFAADTGHSLHSTAPEAYQSLLRQIIEQAAVESEQQE
jgi:pimeloyl-ACP methyl ester carboxylesterase